MFSRISRPLFSSGARRFASVAARSSAGKIPRNVFMATMITGAAISVAVASQPTVSECSFFDGSSTVDYAAVKKDIIAAIEKEDEKRGDGTGIGPTLVRLAWHACGTYSKVDKTGGSNGATMRFAGEKDWGANAGLAIARDFLEPIKKKYPGISYADLWTLAGVTAIEAMGGPSIPWRAGRTDSSKPTTVPDGRLPGADKGTPPATAAHIRDIFYRMGFNDQVS